MISAGDFRDEFHVARLIRTAASAEERARILLRAPDALLFQQTSEILRACHDTQFVLGMQFVETRVAALCAMRDANGRLPARPRDQVELYRGLVCSLAGEARP